MLYSRSIKLWSCVLCTLLIGLFSLGVFAQSNPQFTNYTGQTLTTTEQAIIREYLGKSNVVPSENPPQSPRFILHDTSILLPPSFLQREMVQNRGPLGLGINGFFPRQDQAIITRPNFYEFRRPSTTKFEQASDIIDRRDREVIFRKVWALTNPTAQQQSLNNALSTLNLTPTEITSEQNKATVQLNSSKGNVFSTGTWAIEDICTRALGGDQSMVNNPANIYDLNSHCNTLTNYFNTRNDRIQSSVTTEIIQVGVKSPRGNQTTCVPSNRNIAPLPKPPYSDLQYNGVVDLYLESALVAGKFPEITTHFALDAFDKVDGHCDPRCFNLNRLYNAIADVMGHPRGSIYGITPSYGTRSGINNVWWNAGICYSRAPV